MAFVLDQTTGAIVNVILKAGDILPGVYNVGPAGAIRGGQTDFNTGKGFFLGASGGEYKFSLGDPANQNLIWDGTNLTIRGEGSGVTNINGGNIQAGTITASNIAAATITGDKIAASTITADKLSVGQLSAISINTGGLTISGVLNIGASGGIYQGTGTFASPTTGLKIYNSGGVGLLEMWGGGTKQVYMGTDGKLKATEDVVFDSSGLSLSPGTVAPGSVGPSKKVKWVTPNGSVAETFASTYSSADVYMNEMDLTAKYYVVGTQPYLGRVSIQAEYDSVPDTIGIVIDPQYQLSYKAVRINAGDGRIQLLSNVYATGGLNVGSATGAGTGGIAYSGYLCPYRSGALQTAQALVSSGTVSASADLTLTTTATDFLVTTQTFVDGVLVVVAHVVCMCSSFTALTDVNAQLILDGSNVLDACVVNVLMQWDRKDMTVCWVGSIAAGSHTIRVQVNKLEDQNTIVAQRWYSRMIWQHYT